MRERGAICLLGDDLSGFCNQERCGEFSDCGPVGWRVRGSEKGRDGVQSAAQRDTTCHTASNVGDSSACGWQDNGVIQIESHSTCRIARRHLYWRRSDCSLERVTATG